MTINTDKIEEFMAVHNLNQKELRLLCGISTDSMSKAMNGYDLRPKVVHALAKGMGIPVEALFSGCPLSVRVVVDEGGKMPTRAHRYDGGLDLYSPCDAVVYPGESAVIDTLIHMEIPENYVGFLKSKSGLNVKEGIVSEGVIDCGYTGTIKVKLYNHGKRIVIIEKGQKISQLVLLPIITPELVQVESLEETDRGEGGFGSTGKF